jgi:hypothetical protein
MARWSTALFLFFVLAGSALAASTNPPHWPSLEEQIVKAGVDPDSALARLIRANQDFSMLRPEEAKDLIRVPLWLRVVWRKAHPEMAYPADDPTGGYPFVLKEVYEWMLSHQDLRPGPGRASAEAEEEEEVEIGVKSASATLEQRISGAQTVPRSESDIRINFWDPTKIIGASNNISASGVQAQFYSLDGGTTWGQSTLSLQPGDAFHSDPTVDWTSDGTAWSTTIGINSGGTTLRMRAYKSTDNGQTWTFDNTFSAAQTSTDKQIMWTDHSNSSPFKDNIYVIWHNGTPAFMNRRTGPGGAWQTPIQVSGAESTGTAIGDDVKTNSAGDVFGFWPTTTNRKIFVVKSTNGGVSYSTPVQIGSTFDGFDIGVPSFNSRRALIYISGGAFKNATKDLVYASWTDLSGETGCTAAANEPGSNVASTCKTRIWFSRSTDGGATWSPAVKINNQASLNDQYNQWLAVDETTGALSIMYYDTVGDAGRKKSDVWYQSSFDDGQTWSTPFKVTSAQTDETTGGQDNGNQYGDYNGLSGYAGVFFPSWTDRRNGAKEEIWTARISDPACTFTGAPNIGTATATAPNQVQVTWTDGSPSSTSFNVYRATGTCASHGAFTQIASSLAGSPYTDNTVSGTITYAYRVTGLDVTGGCESTPSACVEVTATGACTLPPSFAGLTSVTNQAASTCGLNLAWSAGTPACAGPLNYTVYRSTSSGFVPGPGNQIASGLTGTTYSDVSPLNSGTTYYYIVRATDTSNGQQETNTVEKSAAPTGPIATGTLTETFEGTGFDNPGWTHAALQGATDWVWSTTQSQTPTHSWFSAEQTSVAERVLTTPNFVPQAGTTLSFWHTFAFEGTLAQCYDAGTLEASTDGGSTWTVVPDANFTAGGFTGTANAGFSNPIGGKRAWCSGTIGAMTQVTANLGSFNGASNMKLRWHEGDDVSLAATGWFVDSVTIANAGTAGTCTPTGAPTGLNYFTVTPCRVLDTRDPNGPLGGPALQPSAQRTFTVGGTCGIPVGAKAISINLAVTQPLNDGDLRLFPADVSAPPTSAINFGPGQTRANNAVIPLDPSGAMKVQNDSIGTVHLFIDVNGYFQ